ncbi:MATE family efflux transporter [Spirochaeta isovalerica]|uniref:Multidrug-efflux transporter n=1 Tax=Spirochaeta isovalerica TaxID=150 RepID=A0A841R640_9SPIO|nr:MATE family efflux transporter [Spirochaeta isovalerica]MBB6478851.1 putative MATE family efflux protein [Spirochaeta isovalerica]
MKENTVKKILVTGLPLLASQMSHYLMNVADTAMVGRLGVEQLAAISMSSLFFYVLAVLVWPVSIGVQVITARRYGVQTSRENDPETNKAHTGEVLDNGIVTGLFLGLIGVIAVAAAPPVLSLLITDKSLLPFALGYLSIMRFVFPVIGVASAFTGFLSGIRSTKIVMYTTLVPNLLNIGLNYIFIFGKLGFPAMGIRGAALGTLIANCAAVLILIVYILNSRNAKSYKVFHFTALDKTLIGRVVQLSYPAAIQNGGAFAIFLLYESMVGGIGTVYLASTHIVFSMYRINKTIVGGFARGASILAGNAMGTDNREEANRIIISMEKIAAVVGIIILVSVLSFPDKIVSIYTSDKETIETGMKALRFFSFFFFAEVMGFSLEIIFQNLGWAKFVLFSEALTNILFILASTWLATSVFGLGIYGAWFSFGLYQLFHASILIGGYFSRRWESIKI